MPDCIRVMWSDGIERAPNSGRTSLERGILHYVEAIREEELLRLRWENECFRRYLDEANAPKVARAAAAR